MITDLRSIVYCVLEVKGAEGTRPEDSFHLIINKKGLPKVQNRLTHTPKKVPIDVRSKHKKLFLLFRGFDESEAENVKQTAFDIFRMYYVKPSKPYVDFFIEKPKRGKNVRRSKKRT